MNNHWFGVNRFWGWYPIKTEGWFVAVAMIFSVMATMFVFANTEVSASRLLFKSFPYLSLIISFTVLVASIKGARPEFGQKSSKNYSPDNPRAYLYLSLFVIPFAFYYLLSQAILGATLLTLVFLILFLVFRNLTRTTRES